MSDTDTQTTEAGRPFQLPPATFEFLVESLRMQAEMQLGMMHSGPDDEPPHDLALARHTIDLMAMILEKTRGNLTLEEQRLIENSLTMVRFRYVQAAEAPPRASKPKESPAPQPESQAGDADNQAAPADSQKA
jgi:hypothetical protein